MNSPETASDVAKRFLDAGDAVGWFEALYKSAAGNTDAIPWADLKPNPHLIAWLDSAAISFKGRVLCVGCGLGDDAEELSRRGFDEVFAFDISPTAIQWCRKRFPNSRVQYAVADLLNPPTEWKRHFDFVQETYTLQALPLKHRRPAIHSVADFVAPGGSLLIVCRARNASDPLTGPPWPLTIEELSQFETAEKLKQKSLEDFIDAEDGTTRRFRVVYQRPPQ